MQAQKLAVKKGFYVGLSLASVSLLMFTVYAVAFWFGAWLISTGEIQGGDVLTVCALLFDLTQLQYLIAILVLMKATSLFLACTSNFQLSQSGGHYSALVRVTLGLAPGDFTCTDILLLKNNFSP
jgi:hypothetical protein